MQEVVIRGKRKLCFVLADGDVNKLVIPYDTLAPIDYKRLIEMESKGGNMLKTMRDTVCDNGVNALKMYKGMIVVVPKDKPVVNQGAQAAQPDAPVRKRPGPKPKLKPAPGASTPSDD